MANKYMKKIFSIFNHQWNSEQNYMAILSHCSQAHQENKKQQMLVKKKEPLY
jgi:hypothetical protein